MATDDHRTGVPDSIRCWCLLSLEVGTVSVSSSVAVTNGVVMETTRET